MRVSTLAYCFRPIKAVIVGVAATVIVLAATVFAIAVLLWFWQQGPHRSFAHAVRPYASAIASVLR